jgi:lysophospholipase L1-like esterase
MLGRYSSSQALRVQLENPETLGVAGLYVPHHYYLYGPRPSYQSGDRKLRHNSQGCRAEDVSLGKPPTVYRIVAIGGSTTYSTLVRDNAEVFAYKLENLLNDWATAVGFGRSIEILNCGVPGASSAENLLRYVFNLSQYRADMIIIQQGINDIAPRTLPTMSRDYQEFAKTWQEPDLGADTWFLKRLVRAAMHRFSDSVWTHGINYLVRHRYWSKESGADVRHMASNGPWIFESNTRYLASLAVADGATVLLLTEHFLADGTADRATMAWFIQGVSEHNAVLGKIARENSLLFLDLQSKLCGCRDIMSDWAHLNEAGETQKAAVIFAYVTRRLHGERARGTSGRG